MFRWKQVPDAQYYKLYRRKIPEEWSMERFNRLESSLSKFTLDDLEPTSTYEFTISAVTSKGEGQKSDITTIDTAVGNCTPKPKKCNIQ